MATPASAAHLRRRSELLGRTGLYGVLAGALGALGVVPAQALPVPAPITPQFGGGNGGAPVINNPTAASTNVTLNAARTIVDWSSFTVTASEAVKFQFNAASDIVLNRVNSPAVSIDGVLQSVVTGKSGFGGNVWFSSPQGVIFGPNARVNVGGLLATTGNFTDTRRFLDPRNTDFSFSFTGSGYPAGTGFPRGGGTGFPTANVSGGYGGVSVQAGAQVNTGGGLLALIAPFVNVSPGAAITSGGDVLHAGADAFTVTLAQETSGDLDLLQFVIDSPSSVASPLALQGSTTGRNIYVAALGASGLAGAVIDATGTLTAKQATAGVGGDIILSSGAGTIYPGSTPGVSGAPATLPIQLGDATADRDIRILSVGYLDGFNLRAGHLFDGQTTSGVSLQTITAPGDITLRTDSSTDSSYVLNGTTHQGGSFNLGTISSGGTLTLQAASVLGLDLTGDKAVSVLAACQNLCDGGSSLYIGSATSSGPIGLNATGGVANLTNLHFTGAAGAGVLTMQSIGQLQLGAGHRQTGTRGIATGSVSGPGTITGQGVVNLTSQADVAIVLTGAANLTTVEADGGGVNAEAGSFSANTVYGFNGVNLTADTGDLAVGNVQSPFGGATVAATLGNLRVDSFNAGGDSSVTAGGAAGFGSGGTSFGDLTITARSGGATVGDVSVGRSLTISAAGPATLHSATLGGGTGYPGATFSITATGPTGDVVVGGADGYVAGAERFVAQADRDLTIDLQQVVAPDVLAYRRNLSLTGESVVLPTMDGVPTGDLSINVLADGFTYAGVLRAGGAITLAAAGDVTVGGMAAGGAATIQAIGQPYEGGAKPAGGPVSAAPGDVGLGALQVGDVSSGGDIDLEATSVKAGALTSPGRITVLSLASSNPGDPTFVDVASATAFGPMSLTSGGGYLSLGSVGFTDPNGAGTLTLASLNRAGPTVYLGYAPGGQGEGAGSGAISGTGTIGVNAVGDVRAAVTGAAKFDSVSSGLGSVSLSADSVSVGNLASIYDAALVANTGSVGVGNVGAQAGAVTLTPAQGDVAVSGTVSGASVTIAAGGQANIAHAVALSAASPSDGPSIGIVAGTARLTQAESAGDVQITATQGAATVGDVSAQGGLAIKAVTGATLHSATFSSSTNFPAGNPLSVQTTGAGSDVSIGAPDPAIAGQGQGDVTGATRFDVAADRDVTIAIASPIALDSLAAGRNLSLTGATITIPTLAAPLTGSFSATATEGGFGYGSALSVGGAVTILAQGDITLGAVTARGGPVTLQALTPVVDVSGIGPKSLRVNAQPGDTGAGAVSVGDVQSAGDIDLEGASVSAGALTAGGRLTALSLASTRSDLATFLDIGSANAFGPMSLSMDSGGYIALGGVGFTDPSGAGVLDIRAPGSAGASVYLGDVSRNGARAAAGRGEVLGRGTITVAAGGDVQAALTGTASFAGVSSTFGRVTLAADVLTTGDVSAVSGLGLTANTGALTAGALTASAGPVALSAPGGDLLTGAIQGSAISARGLGRVSLGALTAQGDGAGSTILVSGASTAVGPGVADSDITLTASAGPVVAGDLTSGGGIVLAATGGSATLHSARFTSGGTDFPGGGGPVAASGVHPLTVTATGATSDVSIGQGDGVVEGATSFDVAAGRDLTIAITSPIALDSIAVGRNLTLTGTTISTPALPGEVSGDIVIDATDGGYTTTGALAASGGVSVRAAGDIAVVDVSARTRAVSLQATKTNAGTTFATGSVTAGTVSAATTIDIGGRTVRSPSLMAGGAVNVASFIRSSGDRGAGAFVDIGAIAAGGPAALSAVGGYASLGSMSFTAPGGRLSITAAGADQPAVYLGYAQGGTRTGAGSGAIAGAGVVTLAGDGDVLAAVKGPVRFDSVRSRFGVATLSADAITADTVASFGNAVITATAGDLQLGALSADNGLVSATSATGAASVTSARGVGGVTVRAATTASLGSGSVPALGGTGFPAPTGVTVTGASAVLGSANSLATVTVTGTAGSAQAGDVIAGGAVTIAATGGAASLHSATVGSAAGTGYPAGAPAVSVQATGPTGDVSIGQGDGFVRGAGSLSALADRDLTVQVAGDIALTSGKVGRNLTLTGYTVSLAGIAGTPSGFIDIDATQGGFATTAALTADGFVRVRAQGAISVADVTSRTATATLQAIDTTASPTLGAGSVTAGAVSAATDILIGGANVRAASLTAGGGLTAIAYNGGVRGRTLLASFLDVGSVSAFGPVRLESNGGYASLGSLTFTDPSGAGAASLTAVGAGANAYLGYAPGGTRTGAKSGTITGAGALDLSAGGSAFAALKGAANLRTATAGAGQLSLTADALTVGVAQGATRADLTADTGDLAVTTLASAQGPVTAAATAGKAVVGSASGLGITVTAARDASLGSALTPSGTGPYGVSVSGATATLNQATASGDIAVTGQSGAAFAGDLTTTGSVAVRATGGPASLHSAVLSAYQGSGFPGGVTVAASGTTADASLGQGTGFVTGARTITLQGGRDATAAVTGAIVLTSVTAGRDAALSADQLTVTTLNAGQDAVLRTPSATPGSGPFTLQGGRLQAGRDLTATSAGAVALTDVGAARNLSITGQTVTLTTLEPGLGGDLAVRVLAGGFSSTGNLAAGGAVSIDATGPLALADVTARAGGLTLAGSQVAAGALTAGQSVGVTARSGPATLGPVNAGLDLTATASGALQIAGVQAGRDLLLTGASVDFGAGTGVVTRDLSITTTASGFTSASDLSAGRDATVRSAAGASLGGLSAGGSVLADAQGALTAGAVTGRAGSVTLGGASLTTGALTAGQGAQATARNGDASLGVVTTGVDFTGSATGALQVAGLQVAQDVALTGAGVVLGAGPGSIGRNLSVVAGAQSFVASTDLTVGGNATVRSAGDVSLLKLTAQNAVDINATGALVTGDVVGRAAGLTLAAGSVSTGALTAGQSVLVTARSGLATLGLVNAGLDLTATASGGLQIAGVQAGRDLLLTGASVDFGAGTGVVTRDLSITTTAGGFTSASDLAAGRDATVRSAAAASLRGLSAGGSVLADAQRALTAGAVTARTGAVTLGGASLTTGAVTAGQGAQATARGGDASLGVVTTGVDFTGSATGALQVAGLQVAQDAALTGAGVVLGAGPGSVGRNLSVAAGAQSFATSTDLTVGGDATVRSAGDVRLLKLTAQDAVDIDATGALVTGDLTGRAAGVTLAAGSVTTGALTAGQSVLATARSGPATLGLVNAGLDLTATTPGALQIAGAQVGRDLLLTGGSVGLGSGPGAIARDLSITTTAGGFTAAGDLSAGRDAILSVAGDASLRNITAGGSVLADATGSLAGAGIVATNGAVDLRGASVTVGNIASGLSTLITARSGDAALGTATAGTDLTVSAPNGAVRIAAAQAGRDLTLTGVTVQPAATLTAVRDLGVSVTGGDFAATSALSAGRNATLTGVGGVRLTSLTAQTGSATVTADTIVADSVVAGEDLRLTSAGGVVARSLTAGDDLLVSGRTGRLVVADAAITRAGVDAEGDGRRFVMDAGAGQALLGFTVSSDEDGNSMLAGRSGSLSGADTAAVLGDAVRVDLVGAAALTTVTGGSGADGVLPGLGVDVAADSLQLGTVRSASGLRVASSTGDLSALRFDAGGPLSAVSAGALTVSGPATAASDAALVASGPLSTGGVASSGGSVRLSGSAVATGLLSAASDVTASTPGSLQLAGAQAGRDLLLTGAGVDLGGAGSAARDLSVTATNGGLAAAGDLAAGRDATLRATGDLRTGKATAEGSLLADAQGSLTTGDVVAHAGGLTLAGSQVGAGALTAGQSVRVTARSGPAMLGLVNAGLDLTATAGGALQIAGVQAGRDLLLTGASVDFGAGTGVATRDLSIATTAGGFTSASDFSAGRDAAVRSAASASLRGLSAGGSVLADAQGALTAGAVTGRTGSVTLGGASLTTSAVTAGQGAQATARNGDASLGVVTTGVDFTGSATGALQLAGLQVAQDVALTGAGVVLGAGPGSVGRNLSVVAGAQSFAASTDLTVGGNATVRSAGNASLLRLTAQNALNIDATGALVTGDLTGRAAGVTLAGGSVTTGALTAGQSVLATARSGPATLGVVNAGLDLTATSPGALQIAGAQVGRDLLLTGGSVGLGSGPGAIARDLSITTTAGGFTAAGDLSAGRDATLRFAGDASLHGLSAGGSVLADAQGALTAGAVTARTGAVTLGGASLTTGAVTAGQGAQATARGGNASLGVVTTGVDFTGSATGALQLAGLQVAQDVALTGASVVLGAGPGSVGRNLSVVAGAQSFAASTDLTVGGNATIRSAGNATLLKLTAQDAVDIDATGALATGALTAGQSVQVTARSGPATLGLVNAGLDLTATTPGALQIAGAQVGRDLILSGGSVGLGSGPGAITRDLSITTTAGGFTSASDLSAGRDATVRSAAAASLRGLSAGGLLLADAQGALTAGAVTGRTGSVTLGGASLTTGAVTAGQGAQATARNGDASLGVVTAGVDFTGSATGALQVAGLQAGQDAALTGSTVVIGAGPGSIGRNLSVVAGAQSLATSTDLTVGGDATVRSAGNASLLRLTAQNAVDIDATGVLVTGALVGRAAGVTLAAASVTTGALTAGQSVRVTARSGPATLGVVTAELDLTATTPGALQIAGAQVGRDLILSGATIALGPVTGGVGRDLSITVGGDFTAQGDLSSGRDATLSVSGAARLRSLTAQAGDILLGAGTLDADALVAGGDVRASASGAGVASGAPALRIGRITAGDDVVVTAAGGDGVLGSVAITGLGPDREGDGHSFGFTVAGSQAALLGYTPDASGAYVGGGSFSGAATADIRAGSVHVDLTGDAAFRSVVADRTGGAVLTAGSLSVETLSTPSFAQVRSTTGDVTLGGVGAAVLSVDAARNLTIRQSASIPGDVALTAGGAIATSGVSGNGLSLTAAGAISTGLLQARIATVAAGADVNLGGVISQSAATVSGRDLRLGSISAAGDVTLTGAQVLTADITAQGAVTAQASGGLTTTGALKAATVALTGGGPLTLDAVTGTLGDVSLSGSGVGGGYVSAARDLRIDGRAGSVSLGYVYGGRNADITGATISLANASAPGLTLTASGAISVSGGLQGFALEATAGGALSSGDVSFTQTAGRASLSGASVAVGKVSGPGGVTASALTGPLSIASFDLDGAVTLAGTGVRLGGGRIGGDLAAASAADLRTDGLLTVGGDAALSAAGPLSAGAFAVQRSIVLSGTGIATGPLTAGVDLTLDGRSGALSTGALTAKGDTRLAGGGVTVASVSSGGGLQASSSRDLNIAGGVKVGIGANLTAAGAVTLGDLTAAAGPVTMVGSGLSAGAIDAAGDLRLDGGAGGLQLSADFRTGGSAILLAGAPGLSVRGGSATLDLTATSQGGLSATAPLTAGRALNLEALNGLSVQDVSAQSGDLTLTGGTLSGRALSGGRDVILAATAGDLIAQSVLAGRDLTAAAEGVLSLGAIQVGRDLSLTGALVQVGSVTGGGTRNLTIVETQGDFTATGDLFAGGDLTITSAGAVTLASATAQSGSVKLDGARVLADQLTGGEDVALIARGSGGSTGVDPAPSLIVRGIKAGDDVSVSAPAGSLVLGSAVITGLGADREGDGRVLSVAAADNGSAALGYVKSDATFGSGAYTYTADGLFSGATLATVRAGGVDVSTPGDLRLDRVEATSPALGLSLASGGALSVGQVRSAGDGVLSGVGVALGPVDVAGNLTVQATAALTASGSVRAGGSAELVASGLLSTADVQAVGGDASLTGAAVSAGDLGAGRDVLVTAQAGDLAVAEATAGRDVRAQAPGAIRVDLAAAQRDLVLSGASVALGGGGAVQSGRDLSITTTASGFTARGDLIAGRDLTVRGVGAVTLRNVTATAGSVQVSGAQAYAGLVSAGQDVSIQAVGGAAASASNPYGLVVRAIVAGDDVVLASPGGDALVGSVTVAGSGPDGEGNGRVFDYSVGDGYAALLGYTVDNGVRTGGGLFSGVKTASVRGGRVQADLSGAVRLDRVTATRGDVALSAGSLTLGAVQSAGATGLTSTQGDLAAGSLQSGGALSARSAGGLTLTGAAKAGGDLTLVAAGPLSTAGLSAGGALSVSGAGATLGAAVGGGDVVLDGRSGPLSAQSVSSGGDVLLSGASVAVAGATGAGRDVAASSTQGGISLASVSAVRDLRAAATQGTVAVSSVQAGRDLALSGTGVTLGGLTAPVGRDLSIRTSGAGFTASSDLAAARDVTVAGAGAVALRGVTAGGSADLSGASLALGATAITGDLRASASGDLTAAGDVSAGGSATLQAGGALGFSNVLVRTGDAVLTGLRLDGGSVSAGRDVRLQVGGATVAGLTAGRDATLTATGAVGLGALTAGGAALLDVGGLLSLGSARAASARLLVGDLDIATALTAPTVRIEARNGAALIGGAAAPARASLWLSNAEVGRITASGAVEIYAGSTTGAARGDLTVADLSVDPSKIPTLSLFAGSANSVAVQGAVTPTVSGGVVTIGGTQASGWRPGSILLTGSLGTATRVSDTQYQGVRAFSTVNLNAGGDILIGSPRFVSLIQATDASAIDIARDKPGGVTATGAEIGHVFLASGLLNVSASGKLVQQNSSGDPAHFAGTYLINSGAAPFSGTVLTIDPPSVVDLFGAYVTAKGVTLSGTAAASGSELSLVGLAASLPGPENYRFNGCRIGSGVCAFTDLVGPQQNQQLSQIADQAAAAEQTLRPRELVQTVLLNIEPVDQLESPNDLVVTGTGNEEIWRKRRPGGSQ